MTAYQSIVNVEATSAAIKRQRDLDAALKETGGSKAFERFMQKYGKVNTKAAYAISWVKYLRWLRQKGVGLTLDELIKDNLRCVFGAEPEDVETKRRHTDWLSEYVNGYLVKQGIAEATRLIAAAAVIQFYKKNDSPLYGDFEVSREGPSQRPKPLSADDIRAVLRALPLWSRLPFLMEWQSGLEINRVLALTWGDLSGMDAGECPLQLKFLGRKLHRQPFSTFLGRDSIEALRLWRVKWTDKVGREPNPLELVFVGREGRPLDPENLGRKLKRMASMLKESGQVQNVDPRSWHSHALRHSFETQAAHSGVRAEIRNYFEGHISGIEWTYRHTDELHPEDLVREYERIEPYVSLDETEVTLRAEFGQKEADMVKRFDALQADYERMKQEVREMMQTPRPS